MIDTEVETKPDLLGHKRGCGCLMLALSGLLALFLLTFGLGTGQLEAGFILLTGWASFLGRTGPRLHWNLDLIALGVSCTVSAVLLTHWLVGGLVRKVNESRGREWRWPWKWTWCGAAVVALAFVVGMAVGGIVHQAGWIYSSPEPLMVRKGINWKEHVNIQQMAGDLRIAAGEATNNLIEIRRALWHPTNGSFDSPARIAAVLQSSYILFIVGEKNTVRGSLIFPRDPADAAKLGGAFTLDGDTKWLKWEQLQGRLQEYRAALVSF